jgi:hypothetical protein
VAQPPNDNLDGGRTVRDHRKELPQPTMRNDHATGFQGPTTTDPAAIAAKPGGAAAAAPRTGPVSQTLVDESRENRRISDRWPGWIDQRLWRPVWHCWLVCVVGSLLGALTNVCGWSVRHDATTE